MITNEEKYLIETLRVSLRNKNDELKNDARLIKRDLV